MATQNESLTSVTWLFTWHIHSRPYRQQWRRSCGRHDPHFLAVGVQMYTDPHFLVPCCYIHNVIHQ